jgi:hypothetical protein
VRADRDEGDPGAGGGQEPGVGVAAAVVRDLEHVGPDVDAAVEDPRLGLRAQVAGEQHPHAVDRHARENRQVVGLRRRDRQFGRRGEHLPAGTAHRQPLPRPHLLSAGAAAGSQAVHLADPGVRR